MSEETQTTTEAQQPDTSDTTQDNQAVDPAWLDARLDRAKQSAVSSLLSELGFDSADAIKEMSKELATRKQADLTEQQRLEAQLEELTTAKASLETQLSEQATAMQQERVRFAVGSALQRAGVSGDTALSDALTAFDVSAVELDDDGNPTDIEGAVSAFLKDRPHFVTQSTEKRQPADIGATAGKSKPTQAALTESKQQELRKRFNY